MDDQPTEHERGFFYARLRWMPAGCLMWIFLLAACFSLIWIGPLFAPEGESTGTLGIIIFLAGGLGVLWLITRLTEYLTGTSDSDSGNGSPGPTDRGAGTMSWYDNDGGGSE